MNTISRIIPRLRPNLFWSQQHSFQRYFSSKVLLDDNVHVILRETRAVQDLLGAVWSKKIDVNNTGAIVQRTIPEVQNPKKAKMTFDGFANIDDPSLHISPTVTFEFVRSVQEVQKKSQSYIPARARMHAIVEDHHEFVSLLNSVDIRQYDAFEKMNPVHVITICDYVPVRLDSDHFREKALAAHYSSSEVEEIIEKYTIDKTMWYPVETIQKKKNR